MDPTAAQPNPWMILPFAMLLLAIALGPVCAPAWWLKHYPKVALGLGAVTLVYYLGFLQAWGSVLHVGHEYVSFIALIGSLFIVAGGIHITIPGAATPFGNVVFLFVGAVLANFLGTTGASMLLIRPWIRMNRGRIKPFHIVFFIFVVSNIGGCLTPVGDPPLFLGYLKGIPFWWVAEHCWPMWIVGIAFLLAVFYALDWRNARQAPAPVATTNGGWQFDGLVNVFWLLLILGSVFVVKPVFLREGMMLAAAAGSWWTTKKRVHEANQFDFHPIQEVAILFIGIFATMMPALDWLQANAHRMASPSPAQFYWGCGTLSSFLDNAPTYLSFLSASFGRFVDAGVIKEVQDLIHTPGAGLEAALAQHSEAVRHTFAALQQYHASELASGKVANEQIEVAYLLGNGHLNAYIVAISIASVFFGACTYIGNGPNFMVKSIAHHQKVDSPTFLVYVVRYTLPFLLPLLVLIWLIFFR